MAEERISNLLMAEERIFADVLKSCMAKKRIFRPCMPKERILIIRPSGVQHCQKLVIFPFLIFFIFLNTKIKTLFFFRGKI